LLILIEKTLLEIKEKSYSKTVLKGSADLDPHVRRATERWLDENPNFREVYYYQEAMHRLYRITGTRHAKRVLIKLTDQMANSKLPGIKTLRKTICQWRNEILQFFENGLTNGRLR
jgi:transposase